MNKDKFQQLFTSLTDIQPNPYHPLAWIHGEPELGHSVFIGGMTTINAKGAKVVIGDHCDIAAFVNINCADSHKRCIELTTQIERKDITLEHHVFVGSHSVIKGGAHIGHHSVVASGTVVDGVKIPPFSLIYGNPMQIKPGYYQQAWEAKHSK